MHTAKVIAAIVAVVATVAAAGAEGESSAGGEVAEGAPTAGNAAAGKKTYDEICVTCHAADGKGNGGLTGGNFVDEKWRLAKSDAELFDIVKNGTEGKIGIMPALGKALSDQQIRDAIAYIRATYGQ